MSEFSLKVQSRKPGKGSQLTEIRQSSQVPGVVYGLKKESQAIVVDYNPLLNILKEASTSNVITLKLADKEVKVIVREYQQHPVTDKIIHIDFLEVDDKKPIITIVPLVFSGVSKAVKELGGKLEIKSDHVKVQCIASKLPAKLEIDLTGLEEIGKTVLIKDIPAIDGVEILTNANDPVVTVAMPKKGKIIEETEEEAPVEGEEGAEGEAPVEGAEGAEGEAAPAAEGDKAAEK
ncbi:50S ribosomal protein L25 [bacterium]|nr:50S ribosomal protein L25 [bacterium]